MELTWNRTCNEYEKQINLLKSQNKEKDETIAKLCEKLSHSKI